VSRISVSLNFDCGNGISDGRKIVRRQFHVCAAKILFETVQLGGSGNRYDPRLLREQPRQRNLCLGRLLLVCNPPERIDERVWRTATGAAAIASGRSDATQATRIASEVDQTDATFWLIISRTYFLNFGTGCHASYTMPTLC
jgi:hypothetical protein